MLSHYFVIKIYTFASIFCKSFQIAATYLLYPNTSWLQLTLSLSYPVVDLSMQGTIFTDWGFQMNYDLPFNLSSFYNAPIWKLEKRAVADDAARSFHEVNFNVSEILAYGSILKNWFDASKDRHFFDFTAGEFYSSLESLIESYGFHSTCLLQSVCDIAKYPFDAEEHHLIRDLLTFLLTPSWHLGFTMNEDTQRKAYESAERRGMHGLNCKSLYPACRRNFLRSITKVIFDNT